MLAFPPCHVATVPGLCNGFDMTAAASLLAISPDIPATALAHRSRPRTLAHRARPPLSPTHSPHRCV